jgi:serine phosphatase RsbU (regulator of sigma subunit)
MDGKAGVLVIEPAAERCTAKATADFEHARHLADRVGDLLQELHRTRHALWQREAELAAGVPVVARDDEEGHLAARLEAVLKAGAQAVGCQAAAAYLLDEATRQLKLRSCWGLPRTRFLDAPRPLRGAAADLEALVGHAVVLEDTLQTAHWKVPEEFRSAVCVPISSPTVPFGTLWVFCDQPRTFSTDATNLIEIVAGRVAADLERSILLQQNVSARRYKRQLAQAARWQRNHLPRIKPLLDGWQVAGWSTQSDALGGTFHDWCVLPDGNLAIAAAAAQGRLLEAGLTAASLHAALKSHNCYRHTAEQMVNRINETLWTASAGDQFAAFFYGLIEPDCGRIEHVAAGAMHGVVVRQTVCGLDCDGNPPLGTQPDSIYLAHRDSLQRGDILIIFSEGVRKLLKAERKGAFWDWLLAHRDASADELAEGLRSHVDRQPTGDDRTVLVIKREPREPAAL